MLLCAALWPMQHRNTLCQISVLVIISLQEMMKGLVEDILWQALTAEEKLRVCPVENDTHGRLNDGKRCDLVICKDWKAKRQA